jgi:hypothetical protein
MPALQISREEIGSFDLAKYRAIRKRLFVVPLARVRLAAKIYDAPIGPIYLSPNQVAAIEAMKLMTYSSTINSNRWKVLVDLTCRLHHINAVELFSNRRKHKFCLARHELWFVASKYLPWSLPQFGRASGDRDHTTILHGIRSYGAKLESGLVQSELMKAVSKMPLFQDEGDLAACAEA